MRLSLTLLAFVCGVWLDQIYRCDSFGHLLHGNERFKHHLFHFLYKNKHYLKKKGAAVGAAALAAAATRKKKIFPVPFPLPIPIIHQPVIHDPLLTLKFIKHAKLSHLSAGGFGGGLGGGFGYG